MPKYWTKAEREAFRNHPEAFDLEVLVLAPRILTTVEALEKLSNNLTDLMGFVANEAGEVIGVGIDGETIYSPRFIEAFRQLVTLQDELRHGPLAALEGK